MKKILFLISFILAIFINACAVYHDTPEATLINAAIQGDYRAFSILRNKYKYKEKNLEKLIEVYKIGMNFENGAEWAYELGMLYIDKNSSCYNPELAIEFFIKASEKEGFLFELFAFYELGKMYRDGIGVNPDLEKAFYYYKQAAVPMDYLRVLESAYVSVGECYKDGIGTGKDPILAYKYYFLAYMYGFSGRTFPGVDYDEILLELIKQIKPEDITKMLEDILEEDWEIMEKTSTLKDLLSKNSSD